MSVRVCTGGVCLLVGVLLAGCGSGEPAAGVATSTPGASSAISIQANGQSVVEPVLQTETTPGGAASAPLAGLATADVPSALLRDGAVTLTALAPNLYRQQGRDWLILTRNCAVTISPVIATAVQVDGRITLRMNTQPAQMCDLEGVYAASTDWSGASGMPYDRISPEWVLVTFLGWIFQTPYCLMPANGIAGLPVRQEGRGWAIEDSAGGASCTVQAAYRRLTG